MAARAESVAPGSTAHGEVRLDRVLMRPRPAPRVSPLAPFVAYLRLGFPMLAVLAVAVGLIWPLLFGAGAFRLSSAPVAPAGASHMRMESPRFTGADARERLFNVTADTAVQKQADLRVLDLTQPKGDLTNPEGSWVSLTAETGHYDQDKQTLDLFGKVELFRDDGYQVTTEQAAIDFRAGIATGSAPVAGQGPAGHITSDGFRVLDGGRVIEFTGKAHLVLFDAGDLPGLSEQTQ